MLGTAQAGRSGHAPGQDGQPQHLQFLQPADAGRGDRPRALEADLRAALAHNQSVLHFQPQMDHYQLRGRGGTARWQHPERGLGLAAGLHCGLAEETGLILTLGRWELHPACKVLAQWQKDPHLRSPDHGGERASSRQSCNNRFVDDVARALAFNEAPGAPAQVGELTESLLVEDIRPYTPP